MKFDESLLTYRLSFHAIKQVPQMIIYYKGSLFGAFEIEEEGKLETISIKLNFLRNNVKEQIEDEQP
jgi:hypothetical protein